MAQRSIEISSFYGGSADNEKKGKEFANRFARNCNIFEDLDYLTINPKTAKVSGSTVDGLPHWAEDGSPWSTDRYFYASNGDIYKETSGGTWSLLQATSNSSGNGLLAYEDFLYYSIDEDLGRYGLLSGTPAFADTFLTDGTTNLDDSNSATGQTYTLPTTISEAATALQTLDLSEDPLKTIVISVDTVGTGNWTVTVHDASNRVIATKTIAVGSMSTGDVSFTFATAGRIDPDQTYHFHVISTVADGKVDTSVASDLETCDFSALNGILVNSAWHPLIEHLNTLVIGNERYLAVWDMATYDPNKIVFEAGYSVRALAKDGEFVVAGCIKGTDVEGVEDGRLYWWDGIEPTFNWSKNVPAGLVNALHTDSKDRVMGVLGNRGALYHVTSDQQSRIQEPPKLARGKKIEVYPGAMTEWLGRTHIGYAASCDDAAFGAGVYEFGHQKDGLPEVMNMGYTISTGDYLDVDIQLGLVKAFGKDLYIGWRAADGSTYGIDKVIKTNNPFTAASWESLIFDDKRPSAQKLAYSVSITFTAIISGQSVTPKYRKERASSWTSGTAIDTVGATKAELHINDRFQEIEMGFDLVTSSSNFPKILSVKFSFNDLKEEDPEAGVDS
jgi:hypothetical protein